MRISTSMFHYQSINAILNSESELQKTQQQLATGRRMLTPASDPNASSHTMELRQALSTREQYQSNADSATARLNVEESSLAGAGNALQRVRELAVQANNATLTSSDRKSIAVEMRQNIESLMGLANTQDANGEYIFSGHRSETLPFTADAQHVVTYAGDQGSRFLQVGESDQVAVGDSGWDVFMNIPTGNGTFVTNAASSNTGSGVIDSGTLVDPSTWKRDTYTISIATGNTYEIRDSQGVLVNGGSYESGANITFRGIQTSITGKPASGDRFTITPSAQQDVFTTLNGLASVLENASGVESAPALANAVSQALGNIDQAHNRIIDTRAAVGARLNRISDAKNTSEYLALQLNSNISDLEDLDYATAVSTLNLQMLGYQAAQQAYVKVSSLSLFNHL